MALDFSLPEALGRMVTLGMRTFKSMLSDLEATGSRLVGTSVNRVASRRAWKEQMGIKFPLLSEDGDVCSAHGVVWKAGEFMAGRCHRAIFIVDMQGEVRYSWVAKDPATRPDYQRILEVIRSMS